MNTDHDFPSFDDPVPNRGYRWWYIDGTSHDGKHHLVIIAFVGSVFSPFYKRAADRSSTANPMDYCAINVALYSGLQSRWVMTECRADDVQRERDRFHVAGTRIALNGNRLVIDINERAAPIPQRVCGQVTVDLGPRTTQEHALDARQQHHWWPVSPSAKIKARFTHPGLNWSGHGYVDSNRGAEPLHDGFDEWHWSRTHRDDHTSLTYQSTDREGAHSALGLNIDSEGNMTTTDLPSASPLPASPIWRAPRTGYLPGKNRVVKTLEDTPFYARSIITSDAGRGSTMHESLSLKRFRAGWVTTLIPFRMRFPLSR